jgi:hypothetical protein
MVDKTPPQSSLTNYDGVHSWWWAVYDEAIAEMQAKGEESGWKLVDATTAAR